MLTTKEAVENFSFIGATWESVLILVDAKTMIGVVVIAKTLLTEKNVGCLESLTMVMDFIFDVISKLVDILIA